MTTNEYIILLYIQSPWKLHTDLKQLLPPVVLGVEVGVTWTCGVGVASRSSINIDDIILFDIKWKAWDLVGVAATDDIVPERKCHCCFCLLLYTWIFKLKNSQNCSYRYGWMKLHTCYNNKVHIRSDSGWQQSRCSN